MEWEEIETVEPYEKGSRILMEKAEVPGGWLARTITYTWDGYPQGASVTFVPDPEHTW